jgi:hypothetical protein
VNKQLDLVKHYLVEYQLDSSMSISVNPSQIVVNNRSYPGQDCRGEDPGQEKLERGGSFSGRLRPIEEEDNSGQAY